MSNAEKGLLQLDPVRSQTASCTAHLLERMALSCLSLPLLHFLNVLRLKWQRWQRLQVLCSAIQDKASLPRCRFSYEPSRRQTRSQIAMNILD